MKPLIGITTFCEDKPKKTYNSVSFNYVNSIHLAGGTPIIIPRIGSEEDIENYLNVIEALILTGGEDVNPLLYGEKPIGKTGPICMKRDELETKLFLRALEKRIPVLGICRGLQVINVALGGSLYQDINSQLSHRLNHLPIGNYPNQLYHSINIEENSKLHDILLAKKLEVNSFHHQAIRDLGKNLRVTAVASDGIIEAIEYQGDPFVIAVQWHPEDLTLEYTRFLNLFKALIVSIKKTEWFFTI